MFLTKNRNVFKLFTKKTDVFPIETYNICYQLT